MKQTSIEWLFEKLWDEPKDKLTWHSILNKAKEMHKQEMATNCSQQETLYTEEQVREAMLKVINGLVGRELSLAQLKESIIQSLKQPKQ
jgi:hypothetical protein